MSNATVDDPLQSALEKNAKIGGSRMISYGDMEILVPLRDVIAAVDALGAGNLRKTMASVNASLASSFPRVQSGIASQKEAMDCAQDIAIWFANEVIEGRQTLTVN
jgi:hypothetical protein